jgi:hypothetical protein
MLHDLAELAVAVEMVTFFLLLLVVLVSAVQVSDVHL